MEYKKAILDENTVNQLIELSKLWEKEDITWGLRHNTKEDIEELCYLAIDDNKIVGYGFGTYEINTKYRSFANEGDKFFYLSELYVHPDYRNKGIGRHLFKLVEEEAKANANFLTLSTATKDYKKILKFYIEDMDMSFQNAYLFKKL